MSPNNEEGNEDDRYREIDNRRVVAYLPSKEMKWELQKLSDERDIPVSQLVNEALQNILKDKDEDFETRQELLEEKKESEEKLKEVKRDLKVYQKSHEKLEKEVKELRSEHFVKSSRGRTYSEDLIELLRDEEFIEFEEIYDELNISPSDTEVVKGFQEQLKTLKKFGVVEEEERGWRWIG